ncbi:MAG TPA: 2Fe-2S iron-sulfur cluster-binding protein, partial [Candidatus Marinimicrobia bacterium]|nr:2Fe-2S iron-sulfur cluster-binding protein [Candidatus Neomarinimicrobiota bacterium]
MEDNEKVMTESTVRAPKSTTPSTIKAPEDISAIGATIKVAIDGKEIRVPMGTTILNAARMLGINIPTLCHHNDLCISGVCRICVVEVEGMRTLQASCAYPISQPIVVHTHTRKVRQARRHIVDLLLSRHYGECYSCVRNNNCELQ